MNVSVLYKAGKWLSWIEDKVDDRTVYQKMSRRFLVKLFWLFFFFTLLVFQSVSAAEGKTYKKRLKEIVKNNKNELFSPGDFNAKLWDDLKLGYSFIYKTKDGDIEVETKYVLKEVKGNVYIFDYFLDGEKTSYQKAFIEGVSHYYRNGEVEPLYSFDQCFKKLVVGECEYTSLNRTKTLKTSYKKGVWKRTWVYQGLASVATDYAVYDKRKLELYSWRIYENKLQGWTPRYAYNEKIFESTD